MRKMPQERFRLVQEVNSQQGAGIREGITEDKVYIAVRRTLMVPGKESSAHEWFDVSAASHVQELAENNVRKTKELIPDWDAENPVVRYARVEIKEV